MKQNKIAYIMLEFPIGLKALKRFDGLEGREGEVRSIKTSIPTENPQVLTDKTNIQLQAINSVMYLNLAQVIKMKGINLTERKTFGPKKG